MQLLISGAIQGEDGHQGVTAVLLILDAETGAVLRQVELTAPLPAGDRHLGPSAQLVRLGKAHLGVIGAEGIWVLDPSGTVHGHFPHSDPLPESR